MLVAGAAVGEVLLAIPADVSLARLAFHVIAALVLLNADAAFGTQGSSHRVAQQPYLDFVISLHEEATVGLARHARMKGVITLRTDTGIAVTAHKLFYIFPLPVDHRTVGGRTVGKFFIARSHK